MHKAVTGHLGVPLRRVAWVLALAMMPAGSALGQAGITSAAEATGIGIARGGGLPGQAISLQGGVSLAVEIEAPPGRGVNPSIAIHYTGSAATANQGIVGKAWNLDVGSITRVGRRGAPPNYSASDEFYVSINGTSSKLVFVPADGWYHSETESFARFEHMIVGAAGAVGGDYWIQRNPDGTRFYFGYGFSAGSDSRMTDGTRVWRWQVDRVIDKNGNYLTVTYGNDLGQLYPAEMRYTGRTSTPFDPASMGPSLIGASVARQILFAYVPYPTGSLGMRTLAPGFPVVTRQMLSDVTVKMNGSQMRRYHFTYGGSIAGTGLPLLTQVQPYGADNATTLPPTAYTYGNAGGPPQTWTLNQSSYTTPTTQEVIYGAPCSGGDPLRIHDQGMRWVDFDGDGLPDYVVGKVAFTNGCTPTNLKSAWRNRGDGSYEQASGFIIPDAALFVSQQYNPEDGRCDTLFKDNGIRIFDINGDGYPDLVQSLLDNGLHVRHVWLNKKGLSGCNTYGVAGECWEQHDEYNLPTAPVTCGTGQPLSANCIDVARSCIFSAFSDSRVYDLGCQPVDLNGDGMVDLIEGLDVHGRQGLHAWINSGVATAQTSNWASADLAYAPPKPFIKVVREYENKMKDVSMDLGWRFADVNGDGLVDLIRVYLDNTNGSQLSFEAVDPNCFRNQTSGPTGDCAGVLLNNGDLPGWDTHWAAGNDAVFQAYSPRSSVFDATGYTSFVFSSSRPLRNTEMGFDFIDLNGDGLADLVRGIRTTDCSGNLVGSSIATYLNDGERPGWTYAPRFNLPLETMHAFGGFVIGGEGVSLVDVNGDGSLDIVQSDLSDCNTAHNDLAATACVTRKQVWLNNTKPPTLITQVTSPIGGVEAFSYSPSTHFPERFLPFPMQLVTQTTLTPGTSDPPITTSYSYAGGFLLSTPARLEFHGFRLVDQIDAVGTINRTYALTAVPGDATTGSEPVKGKVDRKELWWPGGTLLAAFSTMAYAGDPNAPPPWFAPEKDTFKYVCDQSSICVWTRKEARAFDAFGNALQVVDSGDDGLSRTTWATYQNDTSTNWLLGLKQSERWYAGDKSADDGGAGLLSERLHGFDTLGRLITDQVRLQPGSYATTRHEYDVYGNVTRTWDPRNSPLTSRFDLTPCLDKTFPEQLTNALGHVVSRTYDCASGRILSIADPNGQVKSYGYDTLGRLTAVALPGDTLASPTTRKDYSSLGTPGVQNIKTTKKDGSADGLWTTEFLDGLEKAVAVQAKGDQGISFAATRRDALGRMVFQSVPAYGAVSSLGATLGYDALGRVVSVAPAGLPASTTSYDRRVRTETDALGHAKRFTSDSFGRLVKTEEQWSGCTGGWCETKYNHDLLGNLLEIVDSVAPARSFSCPTVSWHHSCFAYDSASRRTATDDPDMGRWSYSYDPTGNLIGQTDAKGQNTTYSYDALNRLTLVDYPPAGPGPEDITYTYDGTMPAGYSQFVQNCDDGDPCTIDTFNESTGTCSHAAYTCRAPSACESRVVCDGAGGCLPFYLNDGTACSGGSCQAGSCCAPSCAGVSCGGADSCGGVCCAGSGCTSVSCPPCQAPNACGTACVAVANGTVCAGGLCSGGTCVQCTPTCAGKTCGSGDGCGGTCCAGSGCSSVGCPVCQVANACGSACVNKPDGTACPRGACLSGICELSCPPCIPRCPRGTGCDCGTCTAL